MFRPTYLRPICVIGPTTIAEQSKISLKATRSRLEFIVLSNSKTIVVVAVFVFFPHPLFSQLLPTY